MSRQFYPLNSLKRGLTLALKESPAFAVTVEEPRKERTPRLDWAGLLRKTFALDVFVCLMRGGRLKGLGGCEGSTPRCGRF